MAGSVGMGTLTFAGLTAGFRSEDGFNYGGPSVVAVNCTEDGSTDEAYATGDVTEWGESTATIIVDPTEDIDALVGTTGSLVWTMPLGAGTTSATKTGSVILLSAPHAAAKNGLIVASATFKHIGAVTAVDAT